MSTDSPSPEPADSSRSLAELEKLMAEFPDMNPGPVLRLDSDGRIEMLNRAAKEVISDPDVVGKCWYDICPGMEPKVWDDIQSSEDPIQFEAGTLYQCFLYTHHRRPDTGHIFVYGADVTGHRQAEKELLRQREELAEMARFPDMNPGPVIRFVEDGSIVLANRAARRLFEKESLVDLKWQDVCPGMSEDLWVQIQNAKTETVHESHLGDRFIIFTHTPKTERGNYFVYGADATAHHEAEKELEAKSAQIAEMAKFPDMNPGPVIRFVEDGSILLANRAARTLFERDKLEGLFWPDICPDMTDGLWERVLSTDRDVLHEAKVGERTIVFTHTPKTDQGNIFVYGSDITEQKAAERLLAQSEKMATLGTLSAGVAHELNNPAAAAQRGADHLQKAFTEFQRTMVAVGRLDLSEAEYERLLDLDKKAYKSAEEACSLTTMQRGDLEQAIEDWMYENEVESFYDILDDLVEMEFGPEDLSALAADVPKDHLELVLMALGRSFAVYRLLQEIFHGTKRISSIVGALKEYSYLDRAEIQSVDVNKGVRNTLIILNSKIKEGVEVDDQLAADLPFIQAFGSELNQVWTNLIDNAIAAMKSNGSLQIRSHEEDGGVCVHIEDTGPGIPEDIQGRIFDAFFTTKAPGEGTGLGLHTCYSIVVNKHGGKLTLNSEPGKTCFTVWLPKEVRD